MRRESEDTTTTSRGGRWTPRGSYPYGSRVNTYKTSGKDVVLFVSAIVTSVIVAAVVLLRPGKVNPAQGYFQGASPATGYSAWATEAPPTNGRSPSVWQIRVRDRQGHELFRDHFDCPWNTDVYWRWDARDRLWALCSGDVRVSYWTRATDGRWSATAWGTLSSPPAETDAWPPAELLPPRYMQRFPAVARRATPTGSL